MAIEVFTCFFPRGLSIYSNMIPDLIGILPLKVHFLGNLISLRARASTIILRYNFRPRRKQCKLTAMYIPR